MPNKTEIRCFKRWLYLKEIDNAGKKIKGTDTFAASAGKKMVHSQK